MRLGGILLVVLSSCSGELAGEGRADPSDPAYGSSEVVIEFHDAWGRPIAPSRCELLMTSWQSFKVVPLRMEGFRLRIRLDRSWAREMRGGPSSKDGGAYLLIEGPGHAPVLSNRFRWVGDEIFDQDVGEWVFRQTAELSFPDGTRVTAMPGMTREVTLRLREPVQRVVRLTTREGEPLSDVEICTRLYWSTPNNCQVMATRELARGRTDSNGRIEVPDGDWQLGLQIDAPGWLLESPRSPTTPLEQVVRTVDEELTVYLRRKIHQPVRLLVTRWGLRAPDLTLLANLARAPCGATWGPFATTDALGRIERDRVCIGDYDRFWFEGPDGEVLWEADPREMDLSEVVWIDLQR